jgi:streptomycin 6-kinase
VFDAINEVEAALATVQRTLDALTERGHHEQAFSIAKLQFSASMRASWPGNLVPLAAKMDSLATDTTVTLSDDERADIARAAKVFLKICG